MDRDGFGCGRIRPSTFHEGIALSWVRIEVFAPISGCGFAAPANGRWVRQAREIEVRGHRPRWQRELEAMFIPRKYHRKVHSRITCCADKDTNTIPLTESLAMPRAEVGTP